MGTIITARRPSIRTEIADNIYLTIRSYPAETPADYRLFTVSKSSYTASAQPLHVDISPFAYPLFSQNPQEVWPVTIEDAAIGGKVIVEVTSDEPTEYYDAYYGWELFNLNEVGVSSQSLVKNVFLGSKQYVSANLFSCEEIRWSTNTGKSYVVANPNQGTENVSVFPVLLPQLDVDSTDSSVIIEGKGADDAVLWTLRYSLQCAWDTGTTLGFVNRFGVWETFDVIGRSNTSITTTREDYQSAVTGNTRVVAFNGRKSHEFNTGWVDDEGFEELIQDFMVSESTVAYSEKLGFIYLVINTQDTVILNRRANGMKNYTFNFDQANKIIPVI